MKNHYKIHAQQYEDFDHDQDDGATPAISNEPTTDNPTSTVPPPALKTEMLDWLRSDFDDFDLGPDPSQLTSDRVTRSMKKLTVKEKKKEEEIDRDWVHVE